MDTTDPATLPRRFRPILVVALGGAALLALRYQLRAHTYHEISGYVAAIPAGALAAAAGLTVASYLLLSLYDTMALRYAGAGPIQWQVVFGSLISSAVSHTLGGALFAGSSVRYRFWAGWGLTGEQISRAVSLITVTFWLGVLTVSGLALLLDPSLLAGATSATAALLRLTGSLTLVLVAGYVGLAANGRTSIRFRDWTLPLPEPRQALVQVVVSCLDWSLAALVLYLLMPEGTAIGFPAFVGMFVLAQTAGALSQVPGGLGVFDTIIVLALRSQASSGRVVGALIAYRAIYYLIPFAAALVSLGVLETLRQRRAISKLVKSFGKWIPQLAPLLLSGLTFFGGVVLLVSGATPAVPSRLQLLNRILPLALIEAAHLVGSLVGAALIVVAWGLRRRIDVAYYFTLILLAIGAVASLGKGFDFQEALVLALILAVVLPARTLFNRRAALFADPFSPGWIVAVALVLIGVTLVGEFSYKHIDYADDLWWRFSLRGDAPRFLRASVGAFGLLGVVAITRLLRPVTPEPILPDATTLERAYHIYRRSARPESALALIGDKALLFSDSGQGFLMYGVSGRSWVAMGDPVGTEDEQEELVWTFRALVHRHGGWPVFYEVSKDFLPLYVDAGLTLNKLGEEARISLTDFSLEGSNRRGLRQTHRQLEKAGCTFRMLERGDVDLVLPRLRAVSDQWLATKNAREKGFSLGNFEPAYLRFFRIGVIEMDGEIVAFANLWEGAPETELSVDLMRYADGAPSGVMEYLFIRLFLWGREQGYRRFRLGMAPLAGFEEHSLAPLWHRVGTLLYEHGERFYNFRGLRGYKDKFDPTWEPRYLASPGRLALPRVMLNVATLISDGWRGLIGR